MDAAAASVARGVDRFGMIAEQTRGAPALTINAASHFIDHALVVNGFSA